MNYEADARREASNAVNGSLTFRQVSEAWMDSLQNTDQMKDIKRRVFKYRFNEYYDAPIQTISRRTA